SPDPNLVPSMAPFNERYAADYSEEFGAFGGASGYTTFIALSALESCIDAGDATRACVVEALGNLDLDTTPLGLAVSFGDGNQIDGGSFSLFQIQDGGFALLSGDEAMMEEEPVAVEFEGTIKVGFMGPLTGGAAFIGQEQLGFAQVTAEIFTAETGINVEIVEGDTEINPDTGKIVAEQFAADDEILVVIGPAGSQVCESTQPVFEEAGIAHLTPSCTATGLTDPGTATFFRPIPTDDDQSTTIAEHMLNTLGVTSAYLVEDQSSYAVGLVDQVETLLLDGGAAVDRASVTQEETDFSSIATAAIASGADVVFMAGQIEGQLGTLAVQLREQGYEGIYYLPDGGFSLGWVETAGVAAEGTYVTFFAPDPNLVPTMAPYNDLYAEQYTEEFGAFGGASGYVAYIALQAVQSCVEGGDVSRACIVDALTNIDLATTPLGLPVSFGDGNQINGGSFSLFQIQDGGFALLAGDEAMMEEEMLSADEPIKIGFMGPLTGGAAFIGQEQLGFAQVFVDDFNERTGLNVEIVEGDTEINPDTGKIVAEQFAADDEMIAVVGPAGSQVCESTQPVFEEAGLAHLTPSCTATGLTDPGTATFFRPIPTDDDQSTTIATHMLDELGITSAYLVEDQSSYAVGLVDQIETLLLDGGAAVDRASVTQEETDFSSIATAAIASGADVVFMAGQIEGQLGTLAVQLREQGFEGIYYLPDGGFSLGWVETAGVAAEGTYVTFFSPDPNLVSTMAPYNEAYAAAYTEDFGAFGGASGYTTFIALEAIESCVRAGDISRACVVDALTNIDLETTPLGLPVSFGDGNQIDGGSFSLFVIEDGGFSLLDE
ncbi:MAG: ABC transporter substrate-binding protein, partial [Ardenticatenaceae bacterium]|nr:ABC transporter substrate-binding protein [Ardenticatenaceae bacterium]